MKDTIAGFLAQFLPHFAWTPGALGFGLVTAYAALTLHILLAKGDLPWLYPGFADQGVVEEMRDDVKANTLALVTTQIFDSRRRFCMALNEGMPTDFYAAHMNVFIAQYNNTAHQPFQPPLAGWDCEEFQ